MVPRGVRTPAHSRCGCCPAGVEETTRHALFECAAHADIRSEFFENVETVYPAFGSMSTDARFSLLLSEDTPRQLDNFLYRFLIQLFASRERRYLASREALGLAAFFLNVSSI